MKKYLAIIAIFLMMLSGCTIFNSKNSIAANMTTGAVQWFDDTGIDVISPADRLYHIVSDGNGWLYYMSDVDNVLTPVVDSNGNAAKETSVFSEKLQK